MKSKHQSLLLVLGMIFVAAASRLLPHPPNFTAIGAMGLLGGAYLTRKWLAFLIPLVALWLTNIFLDNVIYAQYYDGFVLFSPRSAWVFVAVAAVVLLGIVMLRKVSLFSLLGASIAASLIFFTITNFGSWMIDPIYPKNAAGLVAAYTAGLPFFINTLLANVIFSFAFFGVVEYFGYNRALFKVLRVKS